MRLENTFTVPASAEDAWRFLLDVPRVAPCMPGATLTESDGDRFAGTVKVKLGPIALTYRGTGRFVMRDETARRVVIEAHGREGRGAGTAAATVIAVLVPQGDGTRVEVTTDLTITGRPAQFGRGMIADVSGKLIGEFASCLARQMTAPAAAAAAPAAGAEPVGAAAPAAGAEPVGGAEAVAAAPAAGATAEAVPVEAAGLAAMAGEAHWHAPVEAEPIDLLRITGAGAALRRYAPVALVVAVVAVVSWLLGRRSAGR